MHIAEDKKHIFNSYLGQVLAKAAKFSAEVDNESLITQVEQLCATGTYNSGAGSSCTATEETFRSRLHDMTMTEAGPGVSDLDVGEDPPWNGKVFATVINEMDVRNFEFSLEAQLSLISSMIENPDVFCIADYPHRAVPTNMLKNTPDESDRLLAPWCCVELTELLLAMAGEQNVQTAAIRLLHGALEKWPDVVLLALFQVPVCWD
ncbi:hypothetical protein TELCIR_09690 [Teladorsagia circumcincta]|uniref:CCR4-NOT transcription complex subunit 1 HEAT repeat domain-containing protein n=1 Tax=Teladorsagia circumcincta TaxID=45464 RepID=A0A2G9UE48_TELCI|nr:hypothetical protein TELCIR_09690 [Teladorsagia circumcincta]